MYAEDLTSLFLVCQVYWVRSGEMASFVGSVLQAQLGLQGLGSISGLSPNWQGPQFGSGPSQGFMYYNILSQYYIATLVNLVEYYSTDN